MVKENENKKKKNIQSLPMIPIPAVCENDLLACCGFSEFWDRSMTAVKSGKLEKHRKYYLFNKKRKRGKKGKPKPIIIQNSIQLLHTLLGACTGGWISQCSRGLFTNSGQGCVPTSCVQHFCKYASLCHLWVLFGQLTLQTNEVFFLAVCVGLLWGQWLCLSRSFSQPPPPCPATKNEAHSSHHKKESKYLSLSSKCRKCHHILWSVVPVYTHWLGHRVSPTLSLYMYAFLCLMICSNWIKRRRESSASTYR